MMTLFKKIMEWKILHILRIFHLINRNLFYSLDMLQESKQSGSQQPVAQNIMDCCLRNKRITVFGHRLPCWSKYHIRTSKNIFEKWDFYFLLHSWGAAHNILILVAFFSMQKDIRSNFRKKQMLYCSNNLDSRHLDNFLLMKRILKAIFFFHFIEMWKEYMNLDYALVFSTDDSTSSTFHLPNACCS